MRSLLEKISVLSLSFMLVSTYSVSSALPAMISFFAEQGRSSQEIEFLITVTSLAIMVTLVGNRLLTRFLSERAIMSWGFILIATGGGLPLLTQSYPLIFLGRVVLGLGLGMINARAINLVSLLYQDKERIQMIGLRGASEVLGSASLTAIVGLLLGFGWKWSFAIYLLALPILGLYHRFVPDFPEDKALQGETPHKDKLDWTYIRLALGLALIAFFAINVNTSLLLKIPVMVQEANLGTPREASWILSAMMLMGILAGLVFGWLLERLKGLLLPSSLLIFSVSILVTALAQTFFLLAVVAVISGFFYSVILTLVFNSASENTPPQLLNLVMTVVLLGCNLGGATSAFVPGLLAKLNPTASGAFGVYAIIGVTLSLILAVNRIVHKGKA
ncbi:MFS transporter [Streptococcus ovuberis]|uniref:MFS transporter n=1 Tax=Streptococcus ovuberis TaxID=1936207 RepID=A0A7X6N1M8_9STRE|nr:MFS transporter [Streptococcus ovuberis]NKZ21313.1 MFS transporter [Streptococcus ovuberis]